MPKTYARTFLTGVLALSRSGFAIFMILAPGMALAFCDPPIAPPLTDEDTAKLYRDEFRQEFEMYFSDAQTYFRCLEEERAQVSEEVSETAQRYSRFLNDSQNWQDPAE